MCLQSYVFMKKPFSVAILPPPPPPSLLAGWTINPSVCRRLARGSHLAHHSGRWRASISGSLLSQNLKHPPSKRRPKCCQQTVLHSLSKLHLLLACKDHHSKYMVFLPHPNLGKPWSTKKDRFSEKLKKGEGNFSLVCKFSYILTQY